MSESTPEPDPEDALVEARRREAELLQAQMIAEQIAKNSPEEVAAAAEKERLRQVDAVTGLAICRMVEYRSRTGNYSVPAVVNCTTDSIYQPGVEAGHVPALTSVDRVHLTVFTPGLPGMRGDADNFVVASEQPVSENVAGTYQEWNIPYDPDGGPGTWKWPTRA
jgi:hypothetical protein